jgi:hypothetical protein
MQLQISFFAALVTLFAVVAAYPASTSTSTVVFPLPTLHCFNEDIICPTTLDLPPCPVPRPACACCGMFSPPRLSVCLVLTAIPSIQMIPWRLPGPHDYDVSNGTHRAMYPAVSCSTKIFRGSRVFEVWGVVMPILDLGIYVEHGISCSNCFNATRTYDGNFFKSV